MSTPSWNGQGCPSPEDLAAWDAGEMTGAGARVVEQHAAACARCGAEARGLRELRLELRGLRDAEAPPEGLRARILEGVEFAPRAAPRAARRPWRPWDLLRWSTGLAAAVTVLVATGGGLSVHLPLGGQQVEPRRAPGPESSAHEAPISKGAPAAPAAPAGGPVPAASSPVTEAPDAEARRTLAYSSPHVPAGGAGPAAADGYLGGTESEQGDPTRFGQPGVATLPASSSVGGPVTPEDVERFTRGREAEEVRRKVSQRAELSVRVNRPLEAAQSEVAARVRKEGGYVENAELNAPAEGERTARLRLRVPVERLDAMLDWIASLGEVRAKRQHGEDLTGRWLDQRAEVRELRAEEAKLLTQFRRAKTNAQREEARCGLLTVRPRIRAAEERFALTGKLAALSTVALTLTEEPQARVRGSLVRDLDNTLRAAVNAFLVALRIPATVLIWLAVFSPLWAPCLLVYRWATRMSRQEPG